MKFFALFFLFTSLSFGADLTQLTAIAENAQNLKNGFENGIKPFLKLTLAIFPLLIAGMILRGEIEAYKVAVTAKQEMSEGKMIRTPSGFIESFGGMIVRVFVGLLLIFWIYGTFVKIYADPTSTMSYASVWKMLVQDFYMEIF